MRRCWLDDHVPVCWLQRASPQLNRKIRFEFLIGGVGFSFLFQVENKSRTGGDVGCPVSKYFAFSNIFIRCKSWFYPCQIDGLINPGFALDCEILAGIFRWNFMADFRG